MPTIFPAIPPSKFLNQIVSDIIKTYPLGGGYLWPDPSDGVTTDVLYHGEVVAKAGKGSYCCGLTFEVYLAACERYARLQGFDSYNLREGNDVLSAWGVKKMKSDWYVATGGKGGVVDALVPRGLGIGVELEDVQEGDFIQFWRKSGSGHSAILITANENEIEYFSTQPSTHGIGYRTEKFDSVKKDELYIARAFVPEVV